MKYKNIFTRSVNIAVCFAVIAAGCAYFNTFYNAQNYYRQGMKLVVNDTLKQDSEFFDKHKNELSGFYEVNPIIEKFGLHLPPPTLEENYSDLKRVERELQKKFKIEKPGCEYSVLKILAHAVRENEGGVTAVLFKTTWLRPQNPTPMTATFNFLILILHLYRDQDM